MVRATKCSGRLIALNMNRVTFRASQLRHSLSAAWLLGPQNVPNPKSLSYAIGLSKYR